MLPTELFRELVISGCLNSFRVSGFITVSTGRNKSGCQQTPGSPHYSGAISVRLVGEVHHADIYGGGKSEELFGSLLKQEPGLQSRIILQSKCAIHDGMYDFSREYILNAVDGILQRLNTDYLDILLLHRPDALMEPQDVAVNEHSGFVERYLARGIPVIHLLNVHALCGEGIPFDPVRPPEIGTSPVYFGGWR